MKKWSGIILVIGLLTLAAGSLAYVDLMHYATTPAAAAGQPERKVVAIEKGQNFRQTALLLQSQQLSLSEYAGSGKAIRCLSG